MRHSGPTNPATHGHLRAQPAVFRAQFPPGPPAAAITAELARWHRFAVPFNLIYAPGKPDPVVLPSC